MGGYFPRKLPEDEGEVLGAGLNRSESTQRRTVGAGRVTAPRAALRKFNAGQCLASLNVGADLTDQGALTDKYVSETASAR